MKLSRANLLVREVVTKNKKDPALHQVHVDEDGTTVGSDGTIIMAVEPVTEEPQAMPEFEDEQEAPPQGLGIMPGVVDKVLRNIPKGNLGLELGYAVLTHHDVENREVSMATTNLNQTQVTEGKLSPAPFPEWKGVLRAAKKAQVQSGGGVRVCIDRRALINLLKAMDKACPDPDNAVFIEFAPEAEKQGLMLRAESVQTGQHCIGYLLPLDTQGEWLLMNKWERKVLARSAKRRKRKEK